MIDAVKLYGHHEEKHGFPGMLGSLDCTDWEWFGCPYAYKAQYVRRDHCPNPFILLEVVASQDLCIWYAFFIVVGSNNDINVLHQSPLFNDFKTGRAREIPFVANGVTYPWGYYLIERAHMLNYNPILLRLTLIDGDPVKGPTLYRVPHEPNFLALKRILRYIRGTMGYGLQLFSASTSLLVACFDVDTVTLSRSNFDAEYRDVTNDVAETCWLRDLLCELHTSVSSATLIYCDNVSAVQLSSNLVKRQCTKYIEIHIALVAGGHVRVHVPSHYQFDIFTNGLPSTLFSEFQESLSVCSTLTPTVGAVSGLVSELDFYLNLYWLGPSSIVRFSH
ncbi:ALP1-like protein isoform X1 [Tanacetum coccineum]